jgi:hypothetical protein
MINRKKKSPWSKVNFSLLETINEVPVDLFLRVSEIKYLKIYNKDESTLGVITDKYEVKEVTHFYCRSEEYEVLADNLLSKNIDIGSVRRIEMIKELISITGVSVEVAKKIQLVAEENLDDLKRNPQLSEQIDKIFKSGNYLSQHSVLVSFVACLLARKMEWKSPDVLNKLSYAGILHDLTLTDNILIELKRNENDLTFLNWGEQKIYNTHIDNICSELDRCKEMPVGVTDIIADHHEFSLENLVTNKKSHRSIPQINALFIIADQFCHIIHGEDELELDLFLQQWDKFEEHYNIGNFRKPLECLKSLVFNIEVSKPVTVNI